MWIFLKWIFSMCLCSYLIRNGQCFWKNWQVIIFMINVCQFNEIILSSFGVPAKNKFTNSDNALDVWRCQKSKQHNSTFFRSRWLKQTIDGVGIILLRDIQRTWLSAHSKFLGMAVFFNRKRLHVPHMFYATNTV